MKFVFFALCSVAALAVCFADADAGFFIPKAFYTLDSNGEKANLHPISPHTAHYLRRLRRDSYTSSSSSSSSSSSNGGQIYFTSQVAHQSNEDDTGIANRFGGASSTGATGSGRPIGHIIQTSGVIDNKGNAHVLETTGTIDKSGKIHYRKKEKNF